MLEFSGLGLAKTSMSMSFIMKHCPADHPITNETLYIRLVNAWADAAIMLGPFPIQVELSWAWNKSDASNTIVGQAFETKFVPGIQYMFIVCYYK